MYIYNKTLKNKAGFQKIKIGICPICWIKPVAKNIWVIYHISYSPPQVIMACKYCNWIENRLRNNEVIPLNQFSRSKLIKKYHLKFNIKL